MNNSVSRRDFLVRSSSIAIGGALLGPWLGHVMADVAIFTIGYQIAFAGS